MNKSVYTNPETSPPETSVSTAVKNLINQAESFRNCRPYQLAQQNYDQCAIGDSTCKRFWRSVWVELMLAEYAKT